MSAPISTDGETHGIYLQMSDTTIQYSIGTRTLPGTQWIDILSADWPITIVNTTPANATILNVKATMDLTISKTYADVSGCFIVGSSYITFDGSGNTININNIQNYPGFIQNGTGNNGFIDPTGAGYSNVIVQNFIIDESSPERLSTLYPGSQTSERAGGWLCQSSFGKKVSANQILNCINNNPITSPYCGGIVGSIAGTGLGSSVTINGCVNNGSINRLNSNSNTNSTSISNSDLLKAATIPEQNFTKNCSDIYISTKTKILFLNTCVGPDFWRNCTTLSTDKPIKSCLLR